MTINERVKNIRMHFCGGDNTQFAETLGKTTQYTSNLCNEGKNVGDKILDEILQKFPEVNPVWLKMGEGGMLKDSGIEKLKHNEVGSGVPYFEDVESTGGIIIGKANGGNEVPTFFIDYEHFNDCTAYIQHVGDSMYPKYCAGEIIAVKRVYNLDIILWGEAYLVVTNSNANDLRTVKLVFQNEDKSKITLRSSNPNFKGDTEISKDDIISMFIIKGKITRNQL